MASGGGSFDPKWNPNYQPPRSSGCMSSTCLILTVVGVLGVGGLAVCCGGVFFYFTNMLSTQVRDKLEGNPVLAEHIGEIQEFKLDFVASAQQEGDDVYVYNITGTKGSGVVVVEHVTVSAEEEEILWATLTLPSGEKYDLIDGSDLPDPQFNGPEEEDLE